MAVITRYIVVRDGVELDKVFEDKKEAEAYDKMLDAAERLAAFIKAEATDIDPGETPVDELSVFLAKNGPEVVKILKGIKAPPAAQDRPKSTDQGKAAGEKEEKKKAPAGEKPTAKGKK
jgi:uncharacterized protein